MSTYIETDCTITNPETGDTFEAGGAVVTPDAATVYMPSGVSDSSNPRDWSASLPQFGKVQDWHGNPLGRYEVVSSWPIDSAWSSMQYAIRATINGRKYYGRTLGAGMCVNLRACKHQ